MKILLYGINFAPELTGIGKYTGEMAQWLAAQGHVVRVVTAPPYYPNWSVDSAYSAKRWQRQQWQGVDVWRCPLWVPVQPGGIKRLLHLASFALSSLPVLLLQLRWRADVVWVVEPPLFCAPAACLAARLMGAKAVLHIQDFEVDAAYSLGLLNGAFLKRVVQGLEGWLMRRFDRVSTISARMLALASAKGVDASRLLLFPNWVDMSATPSSTAAPSVASSTVSFDTANKIVSSCNPFRDLLGIDQAAIVALYSGNMGAKQGLEILADVAALCASKAPAIEANIVFVFCGNGVGRANLLERCKGLGQVHFLELQPIEKLNDLLAMADIHLLPQRADAADLVMPSKLTGMLASAKPVVATAQVGTELAGVVDGCGLVVEPENAAAMAQAVCLLAADAHLRQRLGRAGYAYAAQHMEREAVLSKFEASLIDLCAPQVQAQAHSQPQAQSQPIGQALLKRTHALLLYCFLLVVLLVGTQMPEGARGMLEHSINAPFAISSWAHFGLFAAMAMLLLIRPLVWPIWRVLLLAFGLALLTEALQYLFGLGRHARWIDVGIDMAGALAAVVLLSWAGRAVFRSAGNAWRAILRS